MYADLPNTCGSHDLGGAILAKWQAGPRSGANWLSALRIPDRPGVHQRRGRREFLLVAMGPVPIGDFCGPNQQEQRVHPLRGRTNPPGRRASSALPDLDNGGPDRLGAPGHRPRRPCTRVAAADTTWRTETFRTRQSAPVLVAGAARLGRRLPRGRLRSHRRRSRTRPRARR
jgi:hypothetical protein